MSDRAPDGQSFDRHQFLIGTGLGFAAAVLGSAPLQAAEPMPAADTKLVAETLPPAAGGQSHLEALMAGNARFASGQPLCLPATARRAELANGQAPFAAVLGCSDSRVPVEAIFDHNPGDIFAVRIAGNFVDNVGLGSLEYAVAVLKATLVLVLGHSNCGAVSSAVKYVKEGTVAPGHIQAIVQAIAPAATAVKGEHGDWTANAIVENVHINIAALTARSTILADALKAGTITIHGGVYDLHSGKVTIVH
jgi:carbonic anhydrase